MISSLFFAARLAWRQLVFEKAKLVAAIMGVLFACVLVFMQLGFRDSLTTSAASAPIKMQADIFLMHKQTEALWRTESFDRAYLMRALGQRDVASVHPMYMGLAPLKNIDTKLKRTLMVYGYDPQDNLMNLPEVIAQRDVLKLKDNVLFDRASRPEFGDVAGWIKSGRTQTELNDYKINLAGTYLMGTSFAADGNMVVSAQNFMRVFSGRTMDKIDLGLVRVRDKTRIGQVQQDLIDMMGQDVKVMTYPELIAFEQAYWNSSAPIGFIFGMGVIMGLVVGMVIVYQILFTDISNNLSQFATLKAMGYRHGYFVKVVFAWAFYLSVLGFIPGFLLSLYMYHIAEQNIFIPFPMPLSKITFVFSLIAGMCFLAGALAIRKLKSANPADMF
jgi:putative ABC transport system permease protein